MVSAVIITKNEAENISRLIRSLENTVDEVLVIDSGSTDGTPEIATNLGAKVIETEWLGYGETKNFGATKARNNWILSLDADEALSLHLSRVLERMSYDTIADNHLFGFKRVTRFCGHWIRHGAWSRDVVWRLYNKNHTKWNTRLVHESIEVQADTQQQLLAGELKHYSFPSLEHYEQKHDQYASLGAKQLFAQGKKPTFVKLYFSPIWRVIDGYILKGGWRDGAPGWQIAMLDYRHVKDKYRRLQDLYRN